MNLILSEDLPDFQFYLWARGEAEGIRHRWHAFYEVLPTMSYFFGHATWLVGLKFLDQRLNLHPLQWNHRGITTELSGSHPPPPTIVSLILSLIETIWENRSSKFQGAGTAGRIGSIAIYSLRILSSRYMERESFVCLLGEFKSRDLRNRTGKKYYRKFRDYRKVQNKITHHSTT